MGAGARVPHVLHRRRRSGGRGKPGVAVTTRNPCVGNAVPWVRAGVGAVATQGGTRVEYGPELLDLLAKGVAPKEALDRLVAADADRERRQVGVISIDGRSAQWTGAGQKGAESRGDWTAEASGPTFAVQGNSLVSPEVVKAVAAAFQASEGSPRHLADRLIEALHAGQQLGGDGRHGETQSAAVLVADPRPGHVAAAGRPDRQHQRVRTSRAGQGAAPHLRHRQRDAGLQNARAVHRA